MRNTSCWRSATSTSTSPGSTPENLAVEDLKSCGLFGGVHVHHQPEPLRGNLSQLMRPSARKGSSAAAAAHDERGETLALPLGVGQGFARALLLVGLVRCR